MADFSLGDVAALMNNKDNDGLGGAGVGWIILLFIFLLAIGGGNGFLGGGDAARSSLQTAELYSALGSQDLKNDVRSGFTNTYANQAALSKDVLENRYDMQLAMQTLASQIATCCCDLKTAVIEQGQLSRDLFQQNYIHGLQTALSDTKTAYNNAEQSQYILGQIGRFVTNPPCNYSPCSSYGYSLI